MPATCCQLTYNVAGTFSLIGERTLALLARSLSQLSRDISLFGPSQVTGPTGNFVTESPSQWVTQKQAKMLLSDDDGFRWCGAGLARLIETL